MTKINSFDAAKNAEALEALERTAKTKGYPNDWKRVIFNRIRELEIEGYINCVAVRIALNEYKVII